MDFNNLIIKMSNLNRLKLSIELHKEACEADDFILRDFETDYFTERKKIRQYIIDNKIIGMSIKKKSNNPFKSTFKVNTIKSVTINPNTHNPAFSFNEDDSVVDIYQCESL